MNITQAQDLVKDNANKIRALGLAAEPLRTDQFMMASVLILDDLIRRVENLELRVD